MKKYFLFLLLLASSVSVYAINYTGYNEPFNNDSRIQALDDLILNASSSSVGFNQSAVGSGLLAEDTGDYTLVGPVLVFQKSSAVRIYGYNVPRDQQYYMYCDYGAGYISGDFKAQCDIRFLNYVSNGIGSAIKFSSNLGSDEDHQGGSDQAIMVRVYHHWDTNYDYSIGLTVSVDGSYSTDWYYSGINTPFWRYVDLYREGSAVWLEIYSDEARTSLVDNLTVPGSSSATYRYAYWGSTYDNPLSSRLLSWYCDNFKFRPSGVAEGVFYSKDLLDGISNNATALLYESSLDGSNTITLEVSENNSSWTQLQPDLIDPQGAFSLDGLGYSTLYTRWNFSRPGSSGACDLQDLTVIYEGGTGSGPAAGRDWIYLMALPVVFLLGLAVKSLKPV